MEQISHPEIEARFLEIDKAGLEKKLRQLGAVDSGERLLRESIYAPAGSDWYERGKFVRIRQDGSVAALTYKHHQAAELGRTEEIEIVINDAPRAALLLERLGLVLQRQQEKRRHTFHLGETIIDIDTWPGVPAYLEIEGKTATAVRETADALELPWSEAVFESAGRMIEKRYGVPVSRLKSFTFGRVE